MKKFLIVFSVVLIVLLIGFFIWFSLTPADKLPQFLSQFKYEEPQKPVGDNLLYDEADFSENIYDDADFLELLDPYIMSYTVGNIQYSLTEDDVESMGEWAVFFNEYFNTVRHGEHTKYNSYFFDEYYTLHTKKEEFTMQKIYGVQIEELSGTPTLDEEEYAWIKEKNITPVYFNVMYKIKNNNGTFRLNVNSDTYRPQLYILAQTNGEIKIIDIIEYAN